MKKNKAYLIIFLFLFAESLSVFYIFNYTVRTRKPNQTYKSEGVINCFSISSSGRSLVIGSSNGLVSFFSENKLTPSWMYHSASEILFVALSPEGDYAVSLDGNDTINLFSSSPYIVQNEISPRWTYRLKNGAVSDVHSFGGIPPLVFILTTVEGQIKLLSNKGLVWEYMTGAPKVIAKMSFNGCWIAAADSKGRVYLFSVKSAVPIWVVSTELTNVSLFFSQNDNIAVGGLYRDGSGRIYILLLESGDIAWEWRTSEPIHFVSISSDGLNVIAYHEEEDVYIISKDGNGIRKRSIKIPDGVDSVISPPFGSYVLALNPEGSLYFFYIPRSTPLWKYNAVNNNPKIEVTTSGDKVFVSSDEKVIVIPNTFRTGFILGSRILWGVVFFLGVLGMTIILYMMKGFPKWLELDRRDWLSLLLGLKSGTLVALLVQRDLKIAVIAGVICAIGTLLGYKREGFTVLLIGFITTLISSIVLGYFLGLLYWFSGLESDVITLTFTSMISGGKIGASYGVVGGFASFIASRLPFT